MRFLIAISLLCLTAQFINAQNKIGPNPPILPSSNPQIPCAADLLLQEALRDPEQAAQYEALRAKAFDFFKGQSDKNTPPALRGQVVTLPVVFHLVHQNGPENLSDAAVKQALEWLNAAFANSGSFDRGSGVDAGLRFCLAQRDPAGKATTGIVRVSNALTVLDIEAQDIALKNLSRWSPQQYINIWVVREINSLSYGPNVAGYAYAPIFHGRNLDGIVLEARWLLDAATVNPLVHEMGHYFGLYHTFQGGCKNGDCLRDGDEVCDTPPEQSTAGLPCDQTANTCSTDAQSGLSSDLPDPSQNYMDYGSYACLHDFTLGQSNRMDFFLRTARGSLLASRGCLPPCPTPTVARIAQGDTTLTVGASLSLNAVGTNVASYLWELDGVSFGNASTANYTFVKEGVFSLTLTAFPTNGTLCEPSVSRIEVQVVCPAKADFVVEPLLLEKGLPLWVTNKSTGANQFTWFLDGVAKGTQLDTFQFATAGEHTITLVAGEGRCQTTKTIKVLVRERCEGKTFQYGSVKIKEDVFTLDHRVAATLPNGNFLLAGNAGSGLLFQEMTPEGAYVWTKLADLDGSVTLNGMVPTTDGGFVGICDFSSTPREVVAKWDKDGTCLWAKVMPAPKSLLPMSDGGVVVGSNYLVRFDAKGDTLWRRLCLQHEVEDMGLLPDGNIVATGRTSTTISLGVNAPPFLACISPEGKILFNYSIRLNSDWENYNSPIPRRLSVARDGSVYLTGPYSGTVSMVNRFWVARVNPIAGSVYWAKYFVPKSPFHEMYVEDIVADSGMVLASLMRVPQQGWRSYTQLTRIETNGTLAWDRTYTGDWPLNNDIPTNLQNLTRGRDGGYLWANFISYDNWLRKTDALGYAGTCPSVPSSLKLENLAFNLLAGNLVNTTSNLVITNDPAIRLRTVTARADTLCTFACAAGPEVCGNNMDDDNDGLFDCMDTQDCPCQENACTPARNNLWYFSNEAGLDFSGAPTRTSRDGLAGANNPTAVQCDPEGRLLFYVDDGYVYNRFHRPMPANVGSILDGGKLIVPHPGNPNQYYIFQANSLNLKCVLVDMKADSSRGGVFPILLNTGASSGTEANITAVKACGEDAYWVVVKPFLGNDILAFKVGKQGLDPTPVTNTILGPGQGGNNLPIKISPDGRLLAKGTATLRTWELYDFDPSTGLVSGQRRMRLDSILQARGIEFSPNGRFLYVTGIKSNQAGSRLVQYDLEAGDAAAIGRSGLVLGVRPTNRGAFGELQVAPDGKIYIGVVQPDSALSYLDAIHRPNERGASCQYQAKAQALGLLRYGTAGTLVNAIQSDFYQPHIAFPQDAVDTLCALNTAIRYQPQRLPCNADSLSWRLEGLNGRIVPDALGATVTYDMPGSGRLVMRLHTPCGIAADTLEVYVSSPSSQKLNLGPDQLVCDNGVTVLKAPGGFARYRWNNGVSDSTLTTLLPGKYWVDVWDACGNRQSDTVTVRTAPETRLDLGPGGTLCKNETLRYERPPVFGSWKWVGTPVLPCDTCRSVTLTARQNSTYSIIAYTGQGCLSVDTLVFAYRDTVQRRLDTAACKGKPVLLYGIPLFADTVATLLRPALGGIGCDTVLTVRLRAFQTEVRNISATVCPGAFFQYKGQRFPADTVASFFLASQTLGCDTLITVRTVSYPPLEVAVQPMDTTILIGAEVPLQGVASGQGPFRYAWSPASGLGCADCPDPIAMPLASTLYQLVVTDANGCTATDEASVQVLDLCVDMVPNAFTPNGDDLNEWFYPLTQPCVKRVLRWSVYNRWGQRLFERTDFEPNRPNLGWDGTAHGEAQPMEVYLWVADWLLYDGRKISKKGEVSLIR